MENHKDNRRHHGTTANNRSMSDTDSQFDEFHSPLHSVSPLRPDDFPSSPSKAIVAVDKYYTPFRSPSSNHQKPHQTLNLPPSVVAYNRSVREESVTGVATKVGSGSVEEGSGAGGGGVGGERRSRAAVASILRRPKKEVTLERAALGFRVCELILSLIAFSVMASDRTQGWTGDSFDRYREYRYVVATNVIAFGYAAFQAIDMTYQLIYGRHIVSYSLRNHFDFLLDQILAYLLISASSSAATRVDDWVSNWGKDEFTEMATASIGMSFLAFVAFALSSLISGYNLFNQTSL